MFDLAPFPDAIVRGLVAATLMLGWIIILTRAVGLRTFSKMTAFDFVVTLATGSLLASATMTTHWTAFVQAIAGVTAIIGYQVLLALARRRSKRFRATIENEPLLLMRNGVFIDSALSESRVSHSDVLAKLRGANVHDLSTVRAVVLETTGDISVLHGGKPEDTLVEEIRGV